MSVRDDEKVSYYLELAGVIAKRATCLRKMYGAVIVKDDRVVATGFNGAPKFRQNCSDLKYCERQKQNVPSGERYELCRSVHAEMNAVMHAGIDACKGADIYLVGLDPVTKEVLDGSCCCTMCERHILNAGISKVIIGLPNNKVKVTHVLEWADDECILKENENET